MLVTILPFFLAARLTVDDQHRQSEWTAYGPECTYDVLVNMSLGNVLRANDNFCLAIVAELKCQPKGHDTLRCRFANAKIKRPDVESGGCTNANNYAPARYSFADGRPFEIRFDTRGVRNLVVSRTIPRRRLDMIKTIVSQLNVGFEMRESRGRFAIMENSTAGHCEVDVKITRGNAESREEEEEEEEEEEDDSIVDQNLEIGFMSHDDELIERSPPGEYRVEKMREPKRCPRRIVYFFGDHEDYSYGDKQLYMDMITSVSHITIAKDKFVSYTISEGVMKTENKSRAMRPRQNISLRLKRIDLARSPLPEIEDPASASLFAFSNLETIAEDA